MSFVKEAPPLTNRQSKAGMHRAIKKYWQLYLLIIPAIVYYIMFKYAPIYGLQIAFRDFSGAKGIWGSKWVGLKHFQSFFRSYYFWPLLRNTLVLSLYSIAVSFPIPICFALLLNEIRNEKYKRFVQTITYAPHFISTIVLVGTLVIMLSPSYGILNLARKALGFAAVDYMSSETAFRHIFVWSGVWQSAGWGAIVYIAALSNVDPGLHESAVIDGASRFQRMWHINIPCILPTMVIMLILRTGTIMDVGFEKVYLMQNDLNIGTSDVISTYIYRRGLLNASFSFSSAVGLFNNVINFALLLLVNGISRRLNNVSLF